MPVKTEYKTLVIAVAIFMVCFIPRMFLLSKGPFHFDTVDLLVQMRDKAISPHGVYLPLPSAMVVGFGYLKGLFKAKFSDLQFLLIWTAFAASLSSAVLYLTFRKISQEITAAIYALLVSFIPMFFSVTTYARIDHALSFLFSTFIVYYLFKRRWVLAALFTGAAICCRLEITLLVPGLAVYIFLIRFANRDTPRKTRVLAAIRDSALVVLISLGVWVIFSLAVSEGAWLREALKIITKQFGEKKFDDVGVISQFSFSNIKDSLWANFKTAPLLFLFASIGLWQIIRRKAVEKIYFFFFFFAVPFLCIANMEATNIRHFMSFVFFLAYFASIGIASVFRKPSSSAMAASLTALSMFAVAVTVVYPIHKDALQVDFARYLESITPDDSVIITQDEGIFIKYYAKRECIRPPSTSDPDKWQQFFGRVISYLKAGRPLYLITSGLAYDFYYILQKFIDEHFYVILVGIHLNENWRSYLERHVYKEKVYRLLPHP